MPGTIGAGGSGRTRKESLRLIKNQLSEGLRPIVVIMLRVKGVGDVAID